jgi:hypothetical protein
LRVVPFVAGLLVDALGQLPVELLHFFQTDGPIEDLLTPLGDQRA